MGASGPPLYCKSHEDVIGVDLFPAITDPRDGKENALPSELHPIAVGRGIMTGFSGFVESSSARNTGPTLGVPLWRPGARQDACTKKDVALTTANGGPK